MKKIDLELVEELLSTESGLPKERVSSLLNKMRQALKEEEDAKPEPSPPAKFHPYFLFITGPSPEESTGFVVEYEESLPHAEVHQTLLNAVAEANDKSKKKGVFETLGDVIEHLPRKYLKDKKIKLRYKEPAIIKVVDNDLQPWWDNAVKGAEQL